MTLSPTTTELFPTEPADLSRLRAGLADRAAQDGLLDVAYDVVEIMCFLNAAYTSGSSCSMIRSCT